MALTGLKIQKLLPKTNCKECGCNTCMAFAMKLASKKARLSDCPYVSEEAKRVLGAAAEPPVKGVALGADERLKLGAETVLYRHEKTFVNPTALAVNVNDGDAPAAVDAALAEIRDYAIDRVGEVYGVDLVCLTHTSAAAADFAVLARKAVEVTGKPLVLRSRDVEALREAAAAVAGSHALLAGATPETASALVDVAREHGHALAVTAPDLDALAALTAGIKQDGFDALVLEFLTHSPAERFQTVSIARRAALKDAYKPLGYPHLCVLEDEDPLDAALTAINEICKYGGVLVLPAMDRALLATLLTVRLNIFTDPQKPIQVEPKVYPVGEPTPESPVFVTTNFSLTYFIVSGEIENSGISAWLVVPECEGMSVLTAWAAGKFSGATIARFCKEAGLDEQVATREIIIPGYVSQISGELEESLPGWKAVVGPQEAADLESFIKARVSA